MASQGSAFAVPLSGLAAALLSKNDVAGRARLVAEATAQLLPAVGAVVYLNEGAEHAWTAKGTAGDVAVYQRGAGVTSPLLANAVAAKQALTFAAEDVVREDYSHLDLRRTVTAFAYIPFLDEHDEAAGLLEVVAFEGELGEAQVDVLAELVALATPALLGARSYESERNTHLQSISRVTQLYDLEKVFNSTLEMDDLLQIIPVKIREILDVQAVNLWMVNGDSLLLASQSGFDPTVAVDTSVDGATSHFAAIVEDADPLLITDADDPRLVARNAEANEGAIFSLLAVAVMAKGAEVGILEVVNKRDGHPFDDDDLFYLTTIAETAGSALHNASLLQAERKVEILETLVQVSREITSTLDLERVLQAVVNGPATVIPYERATIALEARGGVQVRAVSGTTQVNQSAPDVVRTAELLEWAAALDREVYVRQHGDQIEDERDETRPETRAKFARYFADSGMRSFYAMPLADDQGRLGIIAFESSDPDFLLPVHLEMIQVLLAQATVAVRNAGLYKEVPFIGILEPLLQRKNRFARMQGRKRAFILSGAAVAVLFLAVFPLPMRMSGEATVAPVLTASVQPGVEGVVKRVLVREGERVQQGTLLAELEDWPYQSALAVAQSKHATALQEMNRALATNAGSEAGIQRQQVEHWAAEVARARERLERTQLRSPIDGVVVTPRVEHLVGRRLAPGETLAEIADASRTMVDVGISEREASLLRTGAPVAVKLESYPTRTFRGNVRTVSARSETAGDERFFFARVEVPNGDGALRPGMQGRGKVSAGWRPAGYVVFRGPALWTWSKLWNWFGW